MGSRDAAMPAEYDESDIMAIQALALGQATPAQQVEAIRWIVERAACTYDLSYRGGDPHATAFAEGRRFVGLQIVKLSKIRPDVKKRSEPNEQGQTSDASA